MCPSSGGRGGNDMIWMKKAMALCLALLLVCGAAWAEQENNDRVLAVVNGVQVSVDEVEREFQDNAAFYRESGQSDAEINKLKEELARECVMNELLRQKAAELGLDRFSEEELASYRADAENQYDNMLTYYMDYFADDSLTEDEVREQTVAYFTESGYTVDSILSQQLRDAAQDRLYEQITQTVEMTEDELQAYYDQRVAADRQEFTENVYAFEYALSGESVVTYVPAGFRAVRALLVRFSDEDTMKMFDLTQRREELMADESSNREALAEVDAQIEQATAFTREVMSGIQARLSAGEDFMTLMKEFNEDVSAEMEPFASQGSYVSADSVVWPAEFVQAAMALQKPGDVSQPVTVYYGMYLIRYEGEVPEGPVAIDKVHDALMREAVETKKQDAYQEQIDQWYAQADITLYLDHLTEAVG